LAYELNMSERTQFVDIENTKSTMQPIVCGVPQGSILGPLLYLIYVNDIYKSTEANILSFADDTSLYLSHHNIEHVFNNANLEINNLFEWFCSNKLSLNAKKTKFIVFRDQYSHYNTNNTVEINGIPLSQIGQVFAEKSTKFLGLIIDEFLSWKYHLSYINNKISRSLYQIKQIKNTLPTDSLKTLYFAMIHPYILYGILAWGNVTPSAMKRTWTLQKRAVRYINNTAYNSHTDPLFRKSNILKISDQFIYEVSLFMHDYTMNKLPLSFTNVFKYNHEIQRNYETRQSAELHIKRCDSNYAMKLPLYNFPVLWNNLIRNIDITQSKSLLKKTIKNTMISEYSANVSCNNPYCSSCKN
jgi:hypothetical protein